MATCERATPPLYARYVDLRGLLDVFGEIFATQPVTVAEQLVHRWRVAGGVALAATDERLRWGVVVAAQLLEVPEQQYALALCRPGVPPAMLLPDRDVAEFTYDNQGGRYARGQRGEVAPGNYTVAADVLDPGNTLYTVDGAERARLLVVRQVLQQI